MSKNILFISDNPKSFDLSKDTTFQLLQSSNKKGFNNYYLQEGSIVLHKDKIFGIVSKMNILENDDEWFELENTSLQDLNFFDCVMIRKDPPFDLNYYYLTLILDKLSNRVINSGNILRNFNEKISIFNFKEYITDTIVTSDPDAIINFVRKHKKCVLKKLNLMGGQEIKFVNSTEDYLNSIKKYTNLGQDIIMVQKWIKEAEEGDKRIFIVNGKPINQAIIRKPKEDSKIANIALGGVAVKYTINDYERKMALEIGSELIKHGAHIIGIDVLGRYLTEINLTSPTCIKEINNFHNTDICGLFWDGIFK